MYNHLDGVGYPVGHVALGMCISFWSSACVFTSRCVLVLDTVVLKCVLSFLCCSVHVSVYLGGFSVVTDVFTDYLTGSHNSSHHHSQHVVIPGPNYNVCLQPTIGSCT